MARICADAGPRKSNMAAPRIMMSAFEYSGKEAVGKPGEGVLSLLDDRCSFPETTDNGAAMRWRIHAVLYEYFKNVPCLPGIFDFAPRHGSKGTTGEDILQKTGHNFAVTHIRRQIEAWHSCSTTEERKLLVDIHGTCLNGLKWLDPMGLLSDDTLVVEPWTYVYNEEKRTEVGTLIVHGLVLGGMSIFLCVLYHVEMTAPVPVLFPMFMWVVGIEWMA